MAYEKQTWVDNTTPVDAEHLNHMEEGIGANADDIAELSADLTDFKVVNVDSMSEMVNIGLKVSMYRPWLAVISADCMNEITNGNSSYQGVAICYRLSSAAVDYVAFGIMGQYIYGGRITASGVNRLFTYTNTNITPST